MLLPSFFRFCFRPGYAPCQVLTDSNRKPYTAVETRVIARRLDRQNARALECLAHAIEYLEDTKPLLAETTPRSTAIRDASVLLTERNRDVFFTSAYLGRESLGSGLVL